MIDERRDHLRFPVMHNVGEPVELQVLHNHKKVSIPGFIMDLSAGGMGILTLGALSPELSIGCEFILDLKLPHLFSQRVEGKIVRIEKGRQAQIHHSNEEWFLGLRFKKIKSADADLLYRMAEDWSICETKIKIHLPDICFRECAYWDLCLKPIKLKGKHGE